MKKLFILISSFLLIANPANANFNFSFQAVTNNNPLDVEIGQNQLFVNVQQADTDQVLFNFTNIGPQPSSITDIYFTEGSLLQIASIDNSDPGVSFSIGANPKHLPGTDIFKSTGSNPITVFSLDSDSPVQPNGINPTESLGVTFALQPNKLFSDVIDELQSGAIKIGIHVQGFGTEGSESFVNNGIVVTPAPAALILACIGIPSISWIKNRRRT